MKKWLIGLCFAGLVQGNVLAEVTPEALLEAVDQMSPAQVLQFQQSLEAKLWEPVPVGFFTRLAVEVGGWASRLDRINYDEVALVVDDLDVDMINGMDVQLLWRVSPERLRLGFNAGLWQSSHARLRDAGYSSIDVSGGSLALVAHYQWLRSDTVWGWAQVAPGISTLSITTVNTPTDEATTLRRFEADYWEVTLLGGLAWRFNPVLHLAVAGGYRFTETLDMDEGGRSSDIRFRGDGAIGRISLGANF